MANVDITIPDKMFYGEPAQLPASKTYSREFYALSGNKWREHETVEFRIPPSNRCYLGKKTYLKFDVTVHFVPDLQSTHLDGEENYFNSFLNTCLVSFEKCGALGCIDAVQIYDYSGVSLLQDIQGHGQLMCLLRDLDTNLFESQFAGYSGTVGQANYQYVPQSYVINNNVNFTLPNKTLEADTGNTFVYFNQTTPNKSIQKDISVQIPLTSFFCALSDQMIPLHNGFTIKIRFNSNMNAFTFCNPVGSDIYTFSDIEVGDGGSKATNLQNFIKDGFPYYSNCSLVCDFYELTPESEMQLIASRGTEEMVVHTKSYRHNTFHLSSITPDFSFILNGNLRSVRNLFWFMRECYNPTEKLIDVIPEGSAVPWDPVYVMQNIPIGKMAIPKLSNRCRNYLHKWWLRVDHKLLPDDKGIESGADSKNTNSYIGYNYSCSDDGTYIETALSVPGTYVTDRSGDAFYHLMQTQNKGGRVLDTLITEKQFNLETPISFGYPYWQACFTKYDCTNPSIVGGANCGKFACGLNLQSRPSDGVDLLNGSDFTGKVVRLEGRFTDDSSLQQYRRPVTIDVYLEHDAFLHIIPGVSTSISF